MENEIKVMSIMAHQDDFEFNAGGTFALLKKRYGKQVKLKILTTTRGASGHHIMNLEETFRRREKEAKSSALLIDAEYECLTTLDGSHVHTQFLITRNTLGGLWNSIRAFEPDYIFCPPIINDPFAGIHIDHHNTACAVRMVMSEIGVPNAYPTFSREPKKRIKLPVVLNVDDTYAKGHVYDIAIDISEVYEQKLQMALCHKSQVFEWLPWTVGENPPTTEEFNKKFRLRHTNVNKRYGLDDCSPREYFKFTDWGKSPERNMADKLFGSDLIKHNYEKNN